MDDLPIFCGCNYCNDRTEYWTSHVFGDLIINSRVRNRGRNLQSIQHFGSNKSNSSCYFHPVRSASFIYNRLHHLYCHICDTNHYLPSNFCFTPVAPVIQTPVSPLDAVPHLHVCCLRSPVTPPSPSSVSYLSYPSLKPWSPP